MSEQYKKLEELSKDYLSKIYKDKTVIRVVPDVIIVLERV